MNKKTEQNRIIEYQQRLLAQCADAFKSASIERHDYKNHLNVILGLCFVNEPDCVESVKEYILDVPNKTKPLTMRVDTGVKLLDSVIAINHAQCCQREIELQVYLDESFDNQSKSFSSLFEPIDNGSAKLAFIVDYIIKGMMEKLSSDASIIEKKISVRMEDMLISITRNGKKEIRPEKGKHWLRRSSSQDLDRALVDKWTKELGASLELYTNDEKTTYIISFGGR